MAYDPMKHLIRIGGNREYLPVAQRLVWFREVHPDWGIETKIEVLDVEASIAVFSATVTNPEGKVMAKATKMETARGFADYIEKSETGAIGRALALCGFGTQFAPELEEGERIVDSPHPVGPVVSPTPPERTRSVAGTVGGIAEAGLRRGRARVAPAASSTAPVCSEAGCSREMTRGQYEFSMKSFGRALCPQCQRHSREEQPAPAAN